MKPTAKSSNLQHLVISKWVFQAKDETSPHLPPMLAATVQHCSVCDTEPMPPAFSHCPAFLLAQPSRLQKSAGRILEGDVLTVFNLQVYSGSASSRLPLESPELIVFGRFSQLTASTAAGHHQPRHQE